MLRRNINLSLYVNSRFEIFFFKHISFPNFTNMLEDILEKIPFEIQSGRELWCGRHDMTSGSSRSFCHGYAYWTSSQKYPLRTGEIRRAREVWCIYTHEKRFITEINDISGDDFSIESTAEYIVAALYDEIHIIEWYKNEVNSTLISIVIKNHKIINNLPYPWLSEINIVRDGFYIMSTKNGPCTVLKFNFRGEIQEIIYIDSCPWYFVNDISNIDLANCIIICPIESSEVKRIYDDKDKKSIEIRCTHITGQYKQLSVGSVNHAEENRVIDTYTYSADYDFSICSIYPGIICDSRYNINKRYTSALMNTTGDRTENYIGLQRVPNWIMPILHTTGKVVWSSTTEVHIIEQNKVRGNKYVLRAFSLGPTDQN